MMTELSIAHGIPLEDEPGIGALTIAGYLREVVARYGGCEALVLRSGDHRISWSYDDLLARAMEVATSLATQPTKGFGLTKQAFNASLVNDLDAQLDLEADLQSQAGLTHDFAEGVAAFRAKRPPVFRGQ